MDDDNDLITLECGCIYSIITDRLWFHCNFHYTNQPVIGDPLYRWLEQLGRAEWQKDKENNE